MGIPLIGGRLFDRRDDAEAVPVAIINETMAARFWPQGDAVGRSLHRQEGEVRVAGIVKDSKYRELNESPMPYLYLPFAQLPRTRATLLARFAPSSGSNAARTLPEAIRNLEPKLPVSDLRSARQHLDVMILPQRIAGNAAVSLGLVGLLLCCLGIYGIVAYSLRRRWREIGIRLSLGASPGGVARRLVREGLVLSMVGFAAGLAAALPAAKALERFLIDGSPVDLPALAVASSLLLVASLAASYLPARRAARIDPVSALRSQ